MKQIEFKPLYPEQIEVRPAEARNGKATLLLYIDSRCAANILNDAVGEFNWQIEYKDVAGQIYGRLSIWDEDRNIWVYKEDTGSESNIEASKGLSSDILKRCLARWGCDYLYTAPRIKIDTPANWYYNEKLTMTFYVKNIEYDGKKIVALAIADRFDNIVFNWTYNRGVINETQDKKVQGTPSQTPEQRRLQQLADWFRAKQKDPAYDKTELVKFKDHYKAQAATFKYPNFDCDKLWAIWTRKASA